MKIVFANPLPSFRIELVFDDKTHGTVDLSELAGRGVFEAWNRPGVFEQIQITNEGALEWPGEIDLCADSIYLQTVG